MVKKNLLLLVCLIIGTGCKAVCKTVLLYTFYTPSHEILLKEWFLPSLQDEFKVVVKKFEQECQSGTYMQKGWTKMMLCKVDLIIEAIQEQWGNIVIYADVDIQFFAPIQDKIEKCLQDKDLVVQKDNNMGALCAGFMAMRANEQTLKLFKKIRNRMIANPGQSDQPTLNQLLIKEKYTKIQWDYLPICFFGTATVSCITFANNKIWRHGDDVVIPKNIVLHHANYTAGVENKIKLLTYVKTHWMNPPASASSINTLDHKQQRRQRLKAKRYLQSIGALPKKRKIKKRRQSTS